MSKKENKYTNSLIRESSPYLLQHSHNPVNWLPWGEEALSRAKKENKLLIVSIGYAACHWCHVMEHESFEDEVIAKFMNQNFICIKIDREERPDIDHIYMQAVQLITGSGGWPLNCIALPDGRPIHGGTYFTRDQWLAVLSQIIEIFKQNPTKAEEYAESIVNGVKSREKIIPNSNDEKFVQDDINRIFEIWKPNIDYTKGGLKHVPKFPLPIGFQFLLQYYFKSKNKDALQAVTTTLDQMSNGGLYDQIGGGFARYSVDSDWKVPHFEKMLYDNAQLVSLYANAYQVTKEKLYKNVVVETLDFIEREMTSSEGGFYSSIDADSEGKEGQFYLWRYDELKTYLNERSNFILDYYNASEAGNWEDGKNILFKSLSDSDFAQKNNIPENQLEQQIIEIKKILLHERNKRIRPALDDKILTSWNALTLNAFLDAHKIEKERNYLEVALSNAYLILEKIKMPDSRLNRTYKNGESKINAFLDDYAFTIKAFISLYQATFDEKWLNEAMQLLDYTIKYFFDNQSGMFYYTSELDQDLIARTIEITDNVIPSSNSQMAINLHKLGYYFPNNDYTEKAKTMLSNVKDQAIRGGAYYANWSILMDLIVNEPIEVAIVGSDYDRIKNEFDDYYLPNVFFSGGKTEGNLALLNGKLIEDQTNIYVCKNKECNLPNKNIKEVLNQIL